MTTVARQLAGRAATPAVIQEVINNLGLNQPILIQYGTSSDLIHGNLGYSYFNRSPSTRCSSRTCRPRSRW